MAATENGFWKLSAQEVFLKSELPTRLVYQF